MRLLHLSDIHTGKGAGSMYENLFSSIVDWILKNKNLHGADVIILTGDVVNSGFPKEYERAKIYIDKLKAGGMKIFSCPGNHDYGAGGIIENHKCIARFKEYIVGDVNLKYPYCDQSMTYPIVLLDSMLKEIQNSQPFGAQGELGDVQCNALDEILDRLDKAGKRAVVALHHHPFFYNDLLELRDDKKFKEIIKRQGRNGASRVKCVLFGHKHVEKRLQDKESEYGIDVIFASGATTERRSDYDNNLVVPIIDLQDNEITCFRVK